MTAVLKWNGRDLPENLRLLPPGEYFVESAEETMQLTPEEDADLCEANREVAAGETLTIAESRRLIAEDFKR